MFALLVSDDTLDVSAFTLLVSDDALSVSALTRVISFYPGVV